MLNQRAFLTTALLPLFSVPVWAAAGAYKPWQGSFLWLCLFAWVLYFMEPQKKKQDLEPKGLSLQGLFVIPGCILLINAVLYLILEIPVDSILLGNVLFWAPIGVLHVCKPESCSPLSRPDRLKVLLRDPVFWCAVLFMVFLTVQFLNTGRIQVYDFSLNAYTYSPAKYSGLPWSINRIEALEMIRWFGTVLTVLLILRHTWAHWNPTALTWLVMLNGFLSAMLAFIHTATGWEYMYNLKRFGKDVYGSFGYPNHGAVFFILMFAIALGLLLKELLKDPSERNLPTLVFSLVWSPVFFLAANLSTSRAGILGAWLVLLLSLLHLAVLAWPRLHPVQRLYGLVGCVLILGFFVAGFVIVAQPVHLRELQNATVNLNVYNEIEGRFFQIETAFAMWKDHPWYGVGGWGYRYFVSQYLPVEEWSLLMGKGKANVHNDWMQFLAEFGLLGFGLLTACFLPRIFSIFRAFGRKPTRDDSLWSDPLKICVFWGVIMLLLDSQFDIPLRSPAVFIHGVFMLFLLSEHRDSPSLWPPVIDWKRLQPPLFRLKNQKRDLEPEENPEDW